MAYLILQLTGNSSYFDYQFPYEFIDKKYEIGLVKIDGNLDYQTKQKASLDKNNNLVVENSLPHNDIYLRCNLIDSTYINTNKLNTIYRFKSAKDINLEPNNIIYHKVINKPNKIFVELVDKYGNLINFVSVNLTVELHLKEK